MLHSEHQGRGVITMLTPVELLDLLRKGSPEARFEHDRLLPLFKRAKREGIRYLLDPFISKGQLDRERWSLGPSLPFSQNAFWSGVKLGFDPLLQPGGDITDQAGTFTQIQANWTVPNLGANLGPPSGANEYLPVAEWIGLSGVDDLWQAGVQHVWNPQVISASSSNGVPGNSIQGFPLSVFFENLPISAGSTNQVFFPEFPIAPGDLLEVLIFQIPAPVPGYPQGGGAGFVFLNWSQLAQMQFLFASGTVFSGAYAEWIVENNGGMHAYPDYGAVYFDNAQCTFQPDVNYGADRVFPPGPQIVYPGGILPAGVTAYNFWVDSAFPPPGDTQQPTPVPSLSTGTVLGKDLIRVEYGLRPPGLFLPGVSQPVHLGQGAVLGTR
jgi:hypothetical protein